MDLLLVVLIAGFFALTSRLVALFEKLRGPR